VSLDNAAKHAATEIDAAEEQLRGMSAETERVKLNLAAELPQLRAGMNPLLDMIRKSLDSDGSLSPRSLEAFAKVRPACCVMFSWAVPTIEALQAIEAHGPIVEMGAGTGYWAKLLRLRGVDVLAYDKHPGQNEQASHIWTAVRVGTPSVLESEAVSPGRNLLLCWPPYDEPMAYECLEHFQGERVFYVGESPGGCTGDEDFHEKLRRDFDVEKSIDLPQWPGIHDYLSVWRRK
jgi:hypothetical protein